MNSEEINRLTQEINNFSNSWSQQSIAISSGLFSDLQTQFINWAKDENTSPAIRNTIIERLSKAQKMMKITNTSAFLDIMLIESSSLLPILRKVTPELMHIINQRCNELGLPCTEAK